MSLTSQFQNNALNAAMNHPDVIPYRAQRDQHAEGGCRSIATEYMGVNGDHYVIDVLFEYWIPDATVNNDDIQVRVFVHKQTGVCHVTSWHLVHR